MKRIAIIVVMVLISLTASARSIRYFTYAQATRTVQYLNAQREMMIYCGYDYEIETYVLINEIWMERVNSSYFEIWVFGYDAYTGDEIYMPLDLECVWLYSSGHIYNAAQYLRFHASVRTPSFAWYIPPYNPYTRMTHRPGYSRSYHYDVHRHGWMPPAPDHGHGPAHQPLPPYYTRTPQSPRPAPTTTWTPGAEHPTVVTPANNNRNNGGASVTPANSGRNGSISTGGANVNSGRNGSGNSNNNSGTSTTTSSRNGSGNSNNNSGTSTTPSSRNGSGNSNNNNGTSTTTSSRNGRGDNNNNSGTSTTTSSRNGSGNSNNNNGTSTTTSSRNGSGNSNNNNGTSTTRKNDSKTTTTTKPTTSRSTTATPSTRDTKQNSKQETTTPSRGNNLGSRPSTDKTPTRK